MVAAIRVQRVGDSLRSGVLPGRVRTAVLRRLGLEISPDAVLGAGLRLRGDGRLVIAPDVAINNDCLLDFHGELVIESGVRIGSNCLLLTSTHDLGGPEQRCGEHRTQPVRIGAGTWLAAGVVVLPGTTIGAGCVVAAGAVVAGTLAPNTLWATPRAKKYRTLPVPDAAESAAP